MVEANNELVISVETALTVLKYVAVLIAVIVVCGTALIAILLSSARDVKQQKNMDKDQERKYRLQQREKDREDAKLAFSFYLDRLRMLDQKEKDNGER